MAEATPLTAAAQDTPGVRAHVLRPLVRPWLLMLLGLSVVVGLELYVRALDASRGYSWNARTAWYWLFEQVLAASTFFYYVVASSDRWHAAPGFGNRFLVPLVPVWVLGLAVAIDVLERRLAGLVRGAAFRWSVLAAAVALAVVWNIGLIFQWGSGLVPRREAVDFRRVARQQFTAVPQRALALVKRALGAPQAPAPDEVRP